MLLRSTTTYVFVKKNKKYIDIFLLKKALLKSYEYSICMLLVVYIDNWFREGEQIHFQGSQLLQESQILSFRVHPFSEAAWCAENVTNSMSQKLSPLYKMERKVPWISGLLKFWTTYYRKTFFLYKCTNIERTNSLGFTLFTQSIWSSYLLTILALKFD